ncbi:MAG TPA: S9 family peptidase [Edaphobacter sp.]|nr:S9 family peptidase [Edaphobacter sp.]
MRTGVALFALFSFAASGFSQSRRFSAEDLTKIVRVTDPQISPDGKTISIVVGRANLKEDRWDSEIDFVDVATKALRVMTRDRVGAASVRWSPTGDRIAYLAQDGEKKAQIFVMPVNGGESVQLTHSKTSVTVMAWRPDGQALAYAAADEVPERKDEAKFDDAFEVGNNSYLERAAAKPVHLWTVTVSGEAKRLTSGSWSLPVHMAPSGPPSPIAYTPDGRSIVFVRAESPITGDSDTARLQIADAATGATRALTKSAVPEGNVMLSPDGAQVAYGSARDGKRGNEETVYVVPVAGGAGRDVAAALDRGFSGAAWMPDGKALLIAANDGTKVAYWVQPLDGPAKRVALGSLSPSPAVNVGKDGAVALTATDATHPAELFYIAHVGDAPVQMTHLQTVTDNLTLGRQETVTWKSDKLDVDGVLTYPPDYAAGKKYPLVLYIHGGPTATSLETFTPAAQILAAQGWLVLEPNYRGSNNEGNAFETAIVNDASAGPGRDIIAGVKAVEARGIVDEKRIAVSGWSYGGQMTSWMIGNYPEVWKAAVAGAPVTDLVDQYSLSDNNVERVEHYGPSPFVGDNLKSYAVQSPITYAWRVKAPTLIMSDVGDWRVTTTQAYKLYHALKDNGVTVKFVAFPVPGHSPSDPLRSRDVWRRWTAWLAQYLNEPASKTPGGM